MRKPSLILLVAFPLLICVALFFCWTSLKQSFVEWTLKEYCRKHLGMEVTYNKAISLKNNMIHLEEVRVFSVDAEGSSFGIVDCPHAYVKIGFDIKAKTLIAKVDLRDFVLTLDQPRVSSTALLEGYQTRKSHFFDLRLFIQGDGEVIWSRHRSPLNVDFAMSDGLQGGIQWGQVSGRFRVSAENQEIALIGHGVDAVHLFDLFALFDPDLEQISIESGLLSGSLFFSDDQLVAVIDGEGLEASVGCWHGSCPSCHWDSLEGTGSLFFRSGLLTTPLGVVHNLDGEVSRNNGQYHFFAKGESSGVTAISDIVFDKGKVCDGSYVQLESDFLYGELTFRDSIGMAHFLGDDFVLGALWTPETGNCQGEIVCYGEQSFDFILDFSDDLSFQRGTFFGKGIDLTPFSSWSLWGVSIDGKGFVDVEGEFDGSKVNAKVTSDRLTLNKLEFSQAQFVAQGAFDSKSLRLEQCHAFCQGVEVGGDVLISFHPELEIEFYQHTLSGQVPMVQTLLRQLGASHLLLDIPCDGWLSFQDEGGFFKWRQDTKVLEGTFGAELTQGTIKDPFMGTKWENLEASFVYDLGTDHLVIREGKGICEASRGSSIPMVLDHLEVIDFSKRLVTFDFWCGDKKRDLLRACGKTVFEAGLLRVEFDPQVTHFGALYPEEFDLCFDDDGSFDRFHLVTEFQFEDLEEDLRQLFLSHHLWSSFFQDLQGDLFLKLDYLEGGFQTFLHGKNLKTPKQKFQDFQFIGSYDDGEWHIQKLELDDFSLAADLVRGEKGFDVKFLGCRWGETSLLGLDGVISPEWDRVEANLNLVEMDLQDLETIEFLRPFFSQFNPKGSMRANNGKLMMSLNDGDWDLDLKFVASLKNVALDNLQFQDLGKVTVAYQTEKKLLIKGIQSSGRKSSGIQLDVDRIDLDLNRHELSIKGLAFQVPQNHLEALNAFLKRKFPGAVNSSFSGVMRAIKPVHPLIGTVNFSLNPVQSVTEIYFSDGSYQIFNHEWTLKDFKFLKMDGDITLTACCRLWGDWVQLKTQYVGKAFPSGVLALERGDETLNIWWRKAGDPKITLDRIEGVFAGAHIDIAREESHLSGTAMSRELSSKIDIESGKILMTKLNWKGKSGEVTCPLATIFQSSSGQWQVEIPKIVGKSIRVDQRHCWNELIDDTIMVKFFEINNIHGPLLQPEAISGRGSLSFYSPNQPEIRAFPFVKEKIQDLTILKPVSGEIEFELNSGALTVTSLTDVVDRRQLFRYRLPSSHQNVLCADGSLHLLFHLMPNHAKVRMGDLVSLIVEGTIDHPTFSLVKTRELQHQ